MVSLVVLGVFSCNPIFHFGPNFSMAKTWLFGLLHCDLGVTGSSHRNSLSACRGKDAYICPSPDPAVAGASCTGTALYSITFLMRPRLRKSEMIWESYDPITKGVSIKTGIVFFYKILCLNFLESKAIFGK